MSCWGGMGIGFALGFFTFPTLLGLAMVVGILIVRRER